MQAQEFQYISATPGLSQKKQGLPKVSIFLFNDPIPSIHANFNEHQDQYDFMNKWIDAKQELYLQAITEWDSAYMVNECSSCLKTSGYWRYNDCIGNHALCQECCHTNHRNLPFHSIEFWTGIYYERDWLCNLDVIIHWHHSQPCSVQDPVKLLRELQP